MSEQLEREIKQLKNELSQLKKELTELKINTLQPIQSINNSSADQLKNFLIDSNIRFEAEKTFEDFKGHRFDFYLPDNNIIIEYDGEQHFKPVDYFGGEEYFIERQRKDEEKDEYCENKNIHLVRIKYNASMYEMTLDIINAIKQNYYQNELNQLKNNRIITGRIDKTEYLNSKLIKNKLELVESNQICNIINENEILYEYLNTLQYTQVISINKIYKDFIKYFKAFTNDKLKMTKLQFISECSKFFENYTLSDKPMKFNNDITFTLTNADEFIIDNYNKSDSVYQFIEHLKKIEFIQYQPYILMRPLYAYYKSWIKINNPGAKIQSSRTFINKFIESFSKDYTISRLDGSHKRCKFYTLSQFNIYQLFEDSDFNDHNNYKSLIYNEYESNQPTIALINHDVQFNSDLIKEIKSKLASFESIKSYLDLNIIEVHKAFLELIDEKDSRTLQFYITKFDNGLNTLKQISPSELKEILKH